MGDIVRCAVLAAQGRLEISRRVYSPYGVSPTLTAAMGMGGGDRHQDRGGLQCSR